MLDMKMAVQKAKDYVIDVYSTEKIQGLLLEEVEFDEQSNTWFVTYSFYIENNEPEEPIRSTSASAIMAFTNSYPKQYKHMYKILIINASDGSLVSMKIRKNNEK